MRRHFFPPDGEQQKREEAKKVRNNRQQTVKQNKAKQNNFPSPARGRISSPRRVVVVNPAASRGAL
jgi:hypothetical protein